MAHNVQRKKGSSRFDAINVRSSTGTAKRDEANAMIYNNWASFLRVLGEVAILEFHTEIEIERSVLDYVERLVIGISEIRVVPKL